MSEREREKREREREREREKEREGERAIERDRCIEIYSKVFFYNNIKRKSAQLCGAPVLHNGWKYLADNFSVNRNIEI